MSEELVSTEYEPPPVSFSAREWPVPWMGPFLDALAIFPNIRDAARAANVNRTHTYTMRKLYPEFDEAWEEAKQVGADAVESNVTRWALLGQDVTETREVYDQAGNLVGRTITKSKVMSPTLAAMVLRRWKPEYRDSSTIEHSGAVSNTLRLEVDRMPTRERMVELAQLAQQLGLPPGEEHPIIEGSPNGDAPAG